MTNMDEVPYPNEVRLALRLPGDLHKRIVKLANADERSLNAEIVFLLLSQATLAEIRVAAERMLRQYGEANGGPDRA